MGLFKSRLDNCNNSERSSRRFMKNSNEAPYQMLGRRTFSTTIGHKELRSGHFWLSWLSECFSCYLYVFVVCSTRISWTGSIIGHEPNLLAMSLSSGIAMMLLILIFRTVHVNPALTVAFLMTGRIPVMRAILYIVAHCLGAVAAIALLYSISIKGHAGALGLDNPHEILDSWQILIVELVISFVVTLATYATCNYSSYKSAKKLLLEEFGKSSNLFDSVDNEANSSQARQSKHTIVPYNQTSNSFKQSFSTKGFLLNSYHEVENGNTGSICDYEYDNHRIPTQQLKPQVPIEEVMEDECQLLAPNGFSLHITNGQALIIGLAYTLTSLSGIPASGASLNPARSFGPAFIMNRWDHHLIYWIGPILGAVIAGFFYEFIFSPTRANSLCYHHKLFRFSAQDMAKVASKSRFNNNQHQNFSNHPSTIHFRSQPSQSQTLHNHSPLSRNVDSTTNNLITSPTLLNATRDPQLITTSTSVAHLQSSYPISNTFDQISYLQQQHQNHPIPSSQTANFDRCKSTAIINTISGNIIKPHQSTINLPNQRNNNDLGKLLGVNQRIEPFFGNSKPPFSEL